MSDSSNDSLRLLLQTVATQAQTIQTQAETISRLLEWHGQENQEMDPAQGSPALGSYMDGTPVR